MSKIAIVILNWNGQKLLEEFLPSVVKYSESATVYLADNASTDESISYVLNHFPTVKIIRNNDNYGYAQGYNRALKDLEEPYFALVNSDVEVTANWLTPIVDLFEKRTDVSIIQPKILDYKDKSKFEYAGAAGGFIDSYGFPYCRGRVFNSIETDKGQYNDIVPIFWASGACFFIRKSTFEELNGFDVDFFAHQEEIDLCWRAKNEGYQILYCGTSTIYHVGGATLDYQNSRKTYLNFRNSLFMLLKNLPRKVCFRIIFLRLCLDGLAGIKFLFEGKPKHCFAIIQAHFGFYKKAGHFYKKRTTKQVASYYSCKSIAKQYFLGKRKKYNEII